MICVKRKSDGKIFDNNMLKEEGIYEIHFCTSYTQVKIYEVVDGKLKSKDIICDPVGSNPSWIDLIATKDDECGEFVSGELWMV